MNTQNKVRINRQINEPEVRLLDELGENLGVIPTAIALKKSEEAGLDLILISPKAKPPVAKIMDYGKFEYDRQKKERSARAKVHIIETKTIQVKIGTGEHDLELKAKRASEWLKDGHRIKIDLFLTGRSKYMDFNFLKERLQRVLKLITVEYKIADNPKKSPKGLTVVIEKA